jgi:hypothetical protein
MRLRKFWRKIDWIDCGDVGFVLFNERERERERGFGV